MRPYLSVVIPAYNEEKNIKNGALDSVNSYLAKQKYPWEVIVTDDGSKDDTAKVAESFAKKHKGFKVLRQPHRGKGGTVIAGVLAAKADIVIFTDMDQATPIKEVEKVLPKFEKGYDVVIGSRAGRKGAPMLRKLMAYGFAVLRTLILRLPYKDTQCGFKAFNRKAARKIFKRLEVFNERKKFENSAVTAGFDLEVLYVARKLGLKVAEVPVEWVHVGSERVNPIKDSWSGFKDLIGVRVNAISGKYKV